MDGAIFQECSQLYTLNVYLMQVIPQVNHVNNESCMVTGLLFPLLMLIIIMSLHAEHTSGSVRVFAAAVVSPIVHDVLIDEVVAMYALQ